MRASLRSLAHSLTLTLVACSGVAARDVPEAKPPAVKRSAPAPLTLALSSAKAGEPPPLAIPDAAGSATAVDADDSCAEFADVRIVTEAGGPKRHYSLHGYAARLLRLERRQSAPSAHCILVAWPQGTENSAGQRVSVAARIRDSWLRLVENTLSRIPWHHVRLVRRLVIDGRPTEHGIAPFDRQSADDARDGRTIWLHEHLFSEPNHWARGNHGSYWSYHVSKDGVTAHSAPETHQLFSPVLLHEIGHLVMYHLVNASARGVEATAAPSCAHTCGETETCSTLRPEERERNCISPYCMPFRFPASTENWAEQYRFYFQSSRTRQLLSEANAKCLDLLQDHDRESPPWLSGMPDIVDFRPSRWRSCGEKPCKGW
jgi:hypothetical protein